VAPAVTPDDEHTPREEPTDQQLLERVAAGDGPALGLLAERLTPMLRRVLFRLGLAETEVEDTVQEALIRIWQGSARFEARSAVSTWACRIALNLGISQVRGRRLAPVEPAVAVLDAEAEWESRRRAEAVREAVMSLPPHLRTVIVLREFEDLPYRTIAEIVDVPIGTVMSRLHDARSRLRRRLG
jgi:RNA polymerase sigma-70 factor, ECF subfamily